MESSSPPPAPIVLAVDDDEDDVDLLRLLLRKAGIANPLEVYQAGEEFVAGFTRWMESSAHAVWPLLCFLDVKMPAMNGHDLLRWIRGQQRLDKLPVVMLSSSDHPDDISRAAANGAQCYLMKYPQPPVLRAIVAEAERFARGAPARDCFGLPVNLLLTAN